MSPTQVSVSETDKLTILKLFAAGRDAAFVGAAVNMHPDEVVHVASHHGYPDPKKLAWAADIVQQGIDQAARASIPATAPHRARPAAGPQTVAPVAPAPPAGPTGVTPADVAQLVTRALDSANATTRRHGDRLAQLVRELAERLDTEDRVEREKAAAAKARAAELAAQAAARARAAAEVKRLEAELAAARRLLKPAARTEPARVAGADPTAAEVRAWATKNGIPHATAGRVPRVLVDRYLAARDGAR